MELEILAFGVVWNAFLATMVYHYLGTSGLVGYVAGSVLYWTIVLVLR
jgi:hypothetical protein